MGTPPTDCWPSTKYLGDPKVSGPAARDLLSGKALYVMSRSCLLRAEEEAWKSSLGLQLSNLYLQSSAVARLLLRPMSSGLSTSTPSCRQLGPTVLHGNVEAVPRPAFSRPTLHCSMCTMPAGPQPSGPASLDKDDHFRRGREPFMSRQESLSPLSWSPSACKRPAFHLEPSDASESLCLELDGITCAVGRVMIERLGLNDKVPLDVE